jgi:DNA-binding NarL/FixJ family response regulator
VQSRCKRHGRWRATAQELQIAQRAAEALSNRHIGQRVYLSRRTIRTHLCRIYPRLGISGRGELRAALSNLQAIR